MSSIELIIYDIISVRRISISVINGIRIGTNVYNGGFYM